MRGPEALVEHEDRWVTGVGAWFPGERVVFRGRDLLGDLKDARWMALLLYGITGRMPDERQTRLFEGMWVISTSYPDPRLWNNRVAALAGTARSTAALAIGAATAVSEALVYGMRVNMRAFDFFLRARARVDAGAEISDVVSDELERYRGIGGYGRPVTSRDERIAPLMSLAEDLGLSEGSHVKLAFAVERALSKWRLRMNATAIQATLAADQGFSRQEYYQYKVLGFSAGMFPCYADALAKAEGGFFPLRCDRIQCARAGQPRRSWDVG